MNNRRAAAGNYLAIMSMTHAQAATILRHIHARKGAFGGDFDGGIARSDDTMAVDSNVPNGGVVCTFNHNLNPTGAIDAPSGVAGFGTTVALIPGDSMFVGAPTTAAGASAVLTRLNLVSVFDGGFK